jgi:hypothetical protein
LLSSSTRSPLSVSLAIGALSRSPRIRPGPASSYRRAASRFPPSCRGRLSLRRVVLALLELRVLVGKLRTAPTGGALGILIARCFSLFHRGLVRVGDAAVFIGPLVHRLRAAIAGASREAGTAVDLSWT